MISSLLNHDDLPFAVGGSSDVIAPDALQQLVTRDVEKYRKMLADDAK